MATTPKEEPPKEEPKPPKLPRPIRIPEADCGHRSLLLHHGGKRDSYEDRLIATALYNSKETKHFLNEQGAFYRLPSIAEKVKSSPYRKNVNNSFTIHYYKWNDEMLFKYKTLCRGDKIHAVDSFNTMMKFVMLDRPGYPKFYEILQKMSFIDYISMTPLSARYRKNRRAQVRPDLVLGHQPLNVICEPLVLHRMEFAISLRTDRFLSPMLIIMNWYDIRASLNNRFLYCKQVDKYLLTAKVKAFCEDNHDYWKARKKKASPLLLPLANVDPFSLWDRRQRDSGELATDANTTLRTFTQGRLKPHHIFDELNQLPADFPQQFYVLRATHSLHLKMTKYLPTRRSGAAQMTHIQITYPNVHVEQFRENDFDEMPPGQNATTKNGAWAKNGAMTKNGAFAKKPDAKKNGYTTNATRSKYLTIQPTIYDYGPDPVVTFRRKAGLMDRRDWPLFATTYFPDVYDRTDLGSVSGFSTDSFATTMTETPGDFANEWKDFQHLGTMAECATSEGSVQCINRWKLLADRERSTRATREVQERLIKCCMSNSNKLCRNTKNEYFKQLLMKDLPMKFRFFEYDHVHSTQRLEALLKDITTLNAKENKRALDKKKTLILAGAVDRLMHYFPTREFDRHKGLDINFTWAMAVCQRLVPDVIIRRLQNLFGSHDAWVDSSPSRWESARPPCYRQRILITDERRPWAAELAMNVVMFVFIIIGLIILIMLAPFT